MAGKIKLFKFVHMFVQSMGIHSAHLNPKAPIQRECLFFFFLFSFVHHFIALTAFFFCQAQTIQEFNISFHGMLTEFLLTASFLINISHSAKVRAFIEHLEEFIETRK